MQKQLLLVTGIAISLFLLSINPLLASNAPFDSTGGEFGNTGTGTVPSGGNIGQTGDSQAEGGQAAVTGGSSGGTVTYQSYTNFPGAGRISNLCQLITALWYLGFATLFTAVLGMFIWGGYMYVTAGVNAGKVNQAKEIFTNTIIGLIIGLSIFIIINIINPGLLQGNCSVPSPGTSGETLGGQSGQSDIQPKPGESVFPATYPYQGPGPRQSFGGSRSYGPHSGTDFTPCWDLVGGFNRSAWEKLAILAFRDGTVTKINERGLNDIRIQHADGLQTRYSHNSRNLVKVGDTVKAGQEIARVGGAGGYDPHLHFDVFQNGNLVDPASILFTPGTKNPDPSKVKTTGSPRSGCGGL